MFYISLKYSFFFLDSLVFQVNQQNIHTTLTILNVIPVDRGRKLNVHKMFRRHPGRSSECLMCVQFTSCVYWDLSP